MIGRMKLEILDANGNVVDEIPASKRRGLNRVNWSMLTKPPHVPPAASIAGCIGAGRARPAGQLHGAADRRRARLSTEPLTVTLDRRASFTLADRQAQYAAAERVKGMFQRMTKLVARDQRRARSKPGDRREALPHRPT